MRKRKVVIVSDDIRYPSGVSNITKQIILGTQSDFDWVQIAANSTERENNTVIDVSESVKSITKLSDAYTRLYCTHGYGNYATFNKVITSENPDLLLHMSDPHYFDWIYENEYEIRKKIPIGYYHVWDNFPSPTFNECVYKSCDTIATISKLTNKVVKDIIGEEVLTQYIPHGVDTDIYKKLDDKNIINCRKNLLDTECEFVLFCNNRNLKRKQLLTLLESYNLFCDKIGHSKADKTLLLIHTNPIGKHTSNLYEASEYISTHGNVKFSETVVSEQTLCQMYNVANVTINIASNEGFGLSTLESLACETPIIVNKTGGLSEQIDDNNSWGIGIEPTHKVLNGSPKVPFIYEDYTNKESTSDAILEMYNYSEETRNEMGNAGRKFIKSNNYTSSDMIRDFKNYINTTIDNFSPRKDYTVTKF